MIEEIKSTILKELLADFRQRGLTSDALRSGYPGASLAPFKSKFEADLVSFDLALRELDGDLIETGPIVPFDNEYESGVFLIGGYSKREDARLTEAGFKEASKLLSSSSKRVAVQPTQKPNLSEANRHFYAIHPAIVEKCGALYEASAYAEAVEKSFKMVREKLRKLTKYETGSDAFGKGKLYIAGAAAENVDSDFNQAVKFLTMAIDMFRNEKAHTVDGNISDPIRAHQYLSLSSLALSLLENATTKKQPE